MKREREWDQDVTQTESVHMSQPAALTVEITGEEFAAGNIKIVIYL